MRVLGKGGSSKIPARELAPPPVLTTDRSPAPAFPHQLIFVLSDHPGAPALPASWVWVMAHRLGKD